MTKQDVLPGLIVPAGNILEQINSAPCDYDSIVAIFKLLSREDIAKIFSIPDLVESIAGVIHDKLWVASGQENGKAKCTSWKVARAFGHDFCLCLQFQSFETASENGNKFAGRILPEEYWTPPLMMTVQIITDVKEGRNGN